MNCKGFICARGYIVPISMGGIVPVLAEIIIFVL